MERSEIATLRMPGKCIRTVISVETVHSVPEIVEPEVTVPEVEPQEEIPVEEEYPLTAEDLEGLSALPDVDGSTYGSSTVDRDLGDCVPVNSDGLNTDETAPTYEQSDISMPEVDSSVNLRITTLYDVSSGTCPVGTVHRSQLEDYRGGVEYIEDDSAVDFFDDGFMFVEMESFDF
mmetsp:Transcript_22136/g.37083  ORF Transcript_22136/g.37083 Transcript_22136/m.37083 type:complete len:176 (+) Transcript_22136:370-897(+)|eukprot:CAMPEP_0184663182 /NCGR_PEP_ID=MMETSP0308-20130426/46991_1 /TAXON_ID=38269 /ORGANISM="Gloeochaete witrockiana, Strain SAG 46.84" /LENGTH=175 /DNA_ID=CAMNT_0027105745 /DNA_START=337 /DNA_END=864 /DNA_ORIENTATION=-